MNEPRYTIDVGGTYYVSTRSTFEKSSVLKSIISKHTDPDAPPFVDRDGSAFHFVLNFLRNGTVQHIEDRSYQTILILEAGFYGLRRMEYQLTNMNATPPTPDRAATSLS
tara:strand:+ start:8857 stop:9186 length:330 start_codon:yes stop_codon:yes gene_type:complete